MKNARTHILRKIGMAGAATFLLFLSGCGNLLTSFGNNSPSVASQGSVLLIFDSVGEHKQLSERSLSLSGARVLSPTIPSLAEIDTLVIQVYTGGLQVGSDHTIAAVSSFQLDSLETGTSYTFKVAGKFSGTTLVQGSTTLTVTSGINTANIYLGRARTIAGTGNLSLTLSLSDLPSGTNLSKIELSMFSPSATLVTLTEGNGYVTAGPTVVVSKNGLASGSYYFRPIFQVVGSPNYEMSLNVDPLVEIFDGQTTIAPGGTPISCATGDIILSGTKYYVSSTGTAIASGHLPSDPLDFPTAIGRIASNTAVSATYPGTIIVLDDFSYSSGVGQTISKPTVIKSQTTQRSITLTANISSSALFTVSSGGTLTLQNIRFDGEGATISVFKGLIEVLSGGSAILGTGAVLSEGRSANGAGGVNVNGGALTFNGGIINDCDASASDSKGGGVFVYNSGSVVFNSGAINGCSASYGGGVFLETGTSMTVDPGVTTGSISGNWAMHGGGGLVLRNPASFNSGTLTLLPQLVGTNNLTPGDSYFDKYAMMRSITTEAELVTALTDASTATLPLYCTMENTAAITLTSTMSITTPVVLHDPSTIWPFYSPTGTAFSVGSGGLLALKQVTITGSSGTPVATSLMAVNGGRLDLVNGFQLMDHTTTGNGALVNVTGAGSVLNIGVGSMKGGAAVNGGAIFIDSNGTCTIKEAGSIGYSGGVNTASGSGGGIANNGTLTITEGSVSYNTAQYGGGIYNMGTLILTKATIAYNKAPSGGGILSENPGTITLADPSRVQYNTADDTPHSAGGNGGGIYLKGSSLTMTGGDIADNTAIIGSGATGRGGGVYAEAYPTSTKSVFTLSAGTVSNNIANMYAGGVYLVKSELTMPSGSTAKIQANSAGDSGGGIFAMGGDVMISTKINLYGGTLGGPSPAEKNISLYNGGGCISSGSLCSCRNWRNYHQLQPINIRKWWRNFLCR